LSFRSSLPQKQAPPLSSLKELDISQSALAKQSIEKNKKKTTKYLHTINNVREHIGSIAPDVPTLFHKTDIITLSCDLEFEANLKIEK